MHKKFGSSISKDFYDFYDKNESLDNSLSKIGFRRPAKFVSIIRYIRETLSELEPRLQEQALRKFIDLLGMRSEHFSILLLTELIDADPRVFDLLKNHWLKKIEADVELVHASPSRSWRFRQLVTHFLCLALGTGVGGAAVFIHSPPPLPKAAPPSSDSPAMPLPLKEPPAKEAS